jgi:hypothetical protein
MLESFSRTGHPFLRDWRFYDTQRMETLTIDDLPHDRLVELISEGVNRDETDDEPIPQMGYSWLAGNEEWRSPRTVTMHLCGGNILPGGVWNMVDLETEKLSPENESLHTFAIMKAMLLGIVAAWNPLWTKLSPWGYWERWNRPEPWDDEQRKYKRPDGYLPRISSGWMIYLCADYARRIAPPPGIEAEPISGGGLLLVATQETFTAGNPAHDAAADAIQDALLPLQNLPHSSR